MRHAALCAWGLALAIASIGSPEGFAQQPSVTSIAGGGGGNSFLDPAPKSGARILEVHIRSGERVDSVQMLYALPDGRTITGAQHGGRGGGLNILRLDAGEYIVGISGRYGETIDSLRIITNRRMSPVYGGGGGDHDFRIDVPTGNLAIGFTGRSGELLDAIGLVFTPIREEQAGQTVIAGGRGGSAFSDQQIPTGARMAEVRIRAGERIDAIQAIYLLPDGRYLEGTRHGGEGGREMSFRLDSDEYIIGLSGRYGENVDSLQIRTNKRSSQVFGGRGGDRDFRIEIPANSQAIGFAGRSGERLDAIGLTFTGTGSSYQRYQWQRRNPR